MIVAFVSTDNRQDTRQYDKPVPWFGTAPEALLQGFAAHPNLTMHVISCTQVRMTGPKMLAPNIHFHSVHVPKIGWLRTGYRGCIRAVRAKVAEINPDIVHGQGTERECAISAVRSGRPNVITIHGNMRLIAQVNRAKPFSYQWLAARLERLTIPRSDGVVCITNYTQKAVTDLARRTWVVPNAVDQKFFDISRCPESTPVLLCIGNIQFRKNQNALIRALDVCAKTESFRLLFFGAANQDDPYTKEFFNLVAARPWCSYGGTVGRADLREQFSKASALILASLEDNCPMVVLEAMAAGVPVIAPAVGGVPELIDHGRTGLLCDPHHGESMRDQTSTLLRNPNLAAQLATNAVVAARSRFHPHVIAKRHLEIYREVLSTRS